MKLVSQNLCIPNICLSTEKNRINLFMICIHIKASSGSCLASSARKSKHCSNQCSKRREVVWMRTDAIIYSQLFAQFQHNSTHQIQQHSQWPLASNYDVLPFPRASFWYMKGSAVKLPLISMQCPVRLSKESLLCLLVIIMLKVILHIIIMNISSVMSLTLIYITSVT